MGKECSIWSKSFQVHPSWSMCRRHWNSAAQSHCCKRQPADSQPVSSATLLLGHWILWIHWMSLGHLVCISLYVRCLLAVTTSIIEAEATFICLARTGRHIAHLTGTIQQGKCGRLGFVLRSGCVHLYSIDQNMGMCQNCDTPKPMVS